MSVVPNGAFWLGNDGNVWVSGSDGTHSAGAWDANTKDYWANQGFGMIQNPNPDPALTFQAGGGTSSDTGTYTQPSSNPYPQVDYVNQAFNTQKAGYQNQLNVLQPQRQASELGVVNDYQGKLNNLQEDYNTGLGNLATSRNTINTSRERGLKSISDQLRLQGQSYRNQLGAYGAGDSSATGLINQALGQNASNNRGDVLFNSTNQLQGVDQQQQGLDTSFKRNRESLDTWKQDALNSIAQQYLTTKQQLEAEMANADANRYQQLAQISSSYNQQAIDALSHVQNLYADQASQLMDSYRNQFAQKNVQIAPELQQYQVAPIDAGRLAGLAMPSQVNPDYSSLSLLRKRTGQQPLSVGV
jgi:hypothetical protein